MNRLIGLDILRAFAVFLVLGRHMPMPANPGEWQVIWQRAGWIGVDLFFVLSGFLVSGLLFREFSSTGRISGGTFLLRRAWKIYPPFYLLIAITLLLAWQRNRQIDHAAALGEVFFVQNYFKGLWNHTWTLAVEEHFYIGLAIVVGVSVRLGSKRGLKILSWASIGIWIALLIARCVAAPKASSFEEIAFPTHFRADSLIAGAVLAFFYRFHPELTQKAMKLLTISAVLLGFVLVPFVSMVPIEHGRFLWTFGFSALAFVFCVLVYHAANWKSGTSSLPLRCLALIGVCSYSIYLWHMPMKFWPILLLERAFGAMPDMVRLLVYLLSSIFFGVIGFFCVERPMLALRDRRSKVALGGLPAVCASEVK